MKVREMVPSLKKLHSMVFLGPEKNETPDEREIQVKELLNCVKKESQKDVTLEGHIDARYFGNTLLHRAIFNNDLPMVRVLVEVKCDLNCQSSTNETPLCIAERKNEIEIAESLIKAKCDLNIPNQQGTHVLISAAYHNHQEIVEMLMEAKCDLNHSDKHSGYTALSWATYHNNFTIAHLLITAGANVNRGASGSFPFEDALRNKNLFLLSLLLTYGALITAPENLYAFLTNGDKNDMDYWLCLHSLNIQQDNSRALMSDNKSMLLDEKVSLQISDELSERKKHDKSVYELLKKNTPLPDVLNHIIHEYDSPFPEKFCFYKKHEEKPVPLTHKRILHTQTCCVIS